MPSATTRRRARPRARLSGAERREQLLDVTKVIAAERGFHAISIDAIAKRAGVTRPVVYAHFDDLPTLLRALVEREGGRALEQLMSLLPRPQDGAAPHELLTGSFRAFLEAVQDDPQTWRLVLMPSEGAPAVLRERIEAVRGAVTGELARVTPQVLGAAPGAAPPDPELTALSLQAVAEEAARLLLEDPGRYPRERLLEHADWLVSRLASRGA